MHRLSIHAPSVRLQHRELAEEGRQMSTQYVEMASLLMVWGGLWLRDRSKRAVYPLKSWFARFTL